MRVNTSAEPLPNTGKSVRRNTTGSRARGCAQRIWVRLWRAQPHRTAAWQLRLRRSLFHFTVIVKRLHAAEIKSKLYNRCPNDVMVSGEAKQRESSQQLRVPPKLKAQKVNNPPGFTHLDNVVVYVFGVPVNQVDLFGVDVLQRLLVQTVVVHVFIVGFVYVPLFSDERRMRILLRGSGGGRKRREWRGGGIVCSALRGRETGAARYQPAPQTGMGLNEPRVKHHTPRTSRKGSSPPIQKSNILTYRWFNMYLRAWRQFEEMRKSAFSK